MAQVPSAIRELMRVVPLISIYSCMFVLLSFPVVCSVIVVSLAQPLRVGHGAVELVSSFIKFELAYFRSQISILSAPKRRVGRLPVRAQDSLFHVTSDVLEKDVLSRR